MLFGTHLHGHVVAVARAGAAERARTGDRAGRGEHRAQPGAGQAARVADAGVETAPGLGEADADVADLPWFWMLCGSVVG